MELENKLLDTVRDKCSIPSDNALAKKIGVTRALVSSWRVGRYGMSDERIAELCAMASLDGPYWVAQIHAAKAESRAERNLWRAMADRLSAAAAVVALVCVGLPGVANAKSNEINTLRVPTAHILYIMSASVRRQLARMLPLVLSHHKRRNLAHA